MLSERIFLIGLMGAGKTAVGRKLAERFGYTHLDSDAEIVRETDMSVNDIFAQQGEAAFRLLEEQSIDTLTQRPQIVLSTGGGCVERALNREHLRSRGVVVYLCGTPELLFQRLQHDQQRPLLRTADPLARLQELHQRRDPLYRETAHIVLDVGLGSIRHTTDELIRALNQYR